MNAPLAISLRPRTLDDLIGCDKIVQRIRARIKTKRFPKAWMFAGQTGAGKTTLARILSAGLQCYHPVKFGSCLKCYRRLKDTDLIELNMPNTSIQELREALDAAYYHPKPGSLRRIYILDEAHGMSVPAMRLMLKYTEDCPKSTVFMTCTTEPDKIIRPLRRRHKIYALPPLELEDVRNIVKLGLKKIGSDLDSGDLTEKLLEKNVTSPALIMNAIENYAEGADVEEATEVEGVSTIDTRSLCRSIRDGNWEDVAKLLYQAKQEDVSAISGSVRGYLKGILLGEPATSYMSKRASDSILRLNDVRDDLAAVCAVLFKVCRDFGKVGK